MQNPSGARTYNFTVDDGPNRGERTWNFGMGCGEETKFSVTDRGHVWRIDWPEMRQRILEGDPATVPADLAEWMRDMTDGVMPQSVSDHAVAGLTDWLNSNRQYLQFERDNPAG